MNAQKLRRVQPFRKAGQRLANQVCTVPDTQPGVVSKTFDPIDIFGPNEPHNPSATHSELPNVFPIGYA